jgi:hypothetical protein
MSKERILAQLCGKNHPCTTEKFIGSLCNTRIRICKLFGVYHGIQLLIFNKICMIAGDEVLDHFMWVNTKALQQSKK